MLLLLISRVVVVVVVVVVDINLLLFVFVVASGMPPVVQCHPSSFTTRTHTPFQLLL